MMVRKNCRSCGKDCFGTQCRSCYLKVNKSSNLSHIYHSRKCYGITNSLDNKCVQNMLVVKYPEKFNEAVKKLFKEYSIGE